VITRNQIIKGRPRRRADDLGNPRAKVDPSIIFNLGNSGGSDIARDKDKLICQAFDALNRQRNDLDKP
jgi:hypothetical protein